MKVSKLKIRPNNPRRISPPAMEKLKESIQRDPQFLTLRPIVVDEDMTCLGGNQRLTAIQQLGMKDIPDNWVVKASELTEEQRKRFILIDNKEYGEWDYDILTAEWDIPELEDLGFDMEEIEFYHELKNGPDGGGADHKKLCERFIVPPFSVLDARQGYWQNRKRAWLSLGIESELGRGGGLLMTADQVTAENLNYYRNRERER